MCCQVSWISDTCSLVPSLLTCLVFTYRVYVCMCRVPTSLHVSLVAVNTLWFWSHVLEIFWRPAGCCHIFGVPTLLKKFFLSCSGQFFFPPYQAIWRFCWICMMNMVHERKSTKQFSCLSPQYQTPCEVSTRSSIKHRCTQVYGTGLNQIRRYKVL